MCCFLVRISFVFNNKIVSVCKLKCNFNNELLAFLSTEVTKDGLFSVGEMECMVNPFMPVS